MTSYRSSSSFVPLPRFLPKLRPLDFEIFAEITVFRTFFQNTFRYWADFWYASLTWWVTDQVRVSFRSVDFYRSNGPKIGLWNFRRNYSFPHFFSKRFQILRWYLVCKSNMMSYRSSSSFVLLPRFLRKLRPLDFEIFAEITVFQTFFLNACKYWAEILYMCFGMMSYNSSSSLVFFCWYLTIFDE